MGRWVRLLLLLNPLCLLGIVVPSPGNASISHPTFNASNNSDSVLLIPFFFNEGRYTYSGLIDSSIRLGNGEELQVNSFGEVVNFANEVAIKIHDSTKRVPAGQTLWYYQLYVQITIKWRMEGSTPLTYGECIPLFNALRNHFPPNHHFSNHPARVTISERGNIKVIMAAIKLPYLPFAVQYGTLSATGQKYTTRWYAQLDIFSVLDQGIQWCKSHRLTSLVDSGTERDFISGLVNLEFSFKKETFSHYPEFTYYDLRRLLAQIRIEYHSSGDFMAMSASVKCRRERQWLVGGISIGERTIPVGEQELVLHERPFDRLGTPSAVQSQVISL